jgi:hypothetical protein
MNVKNNRAKGILIRLISMWAGVAYTVDAKTRLRLSGSKEIPININMIPSIFLRYIIF